MPDKLPEMSEQFLATLNKFLAVAEALEGSLSIQQIHSVFLYASSCYSAKHIAAICAERGETVDLAITQTVTIYRDMLVNGVKHYNSSVGH